VTAPPPPPCSPKPSSTKASATSTAGANPIGIKRGIDKAVEAGRRRSSRRWPSTVKGKEEIAQVGTDRGQQRRRHRQA
jgi:hypothetical protein